MSQVQLTTGLVTVCRILAEHVQAAILGDDGTAAVVTRCVHHVTRLQTDHLLGLHGLWLSTPLR